MMRHSDASTFNDQLNIMALLLILLFLACFVALFFSPMIHEIVGAVSCLAVMWHCLHLYFPHEKTKSLKDLLRVSPPVRGNSETDPKAQGWCLLQTMTTGHSRALPSHL